MSNAIVHLALAVCLLAAYVGLTVAGHDGNILLGLLGGQAAAVGVDKAVPAK